MISLLLDSSSNRLSVAIAKDSRVIAAYDEPAFQTQSEILVMTIHNLLEETKLKPADITNTVVAYGPGSFTGVRIAVSVSKVMAYALGINLYKVSSLSVFTHKEKTTVAVLDARNKRSFVGVYSQKGTIMEDTILSNDEVLELLKTKDYVLSGETKHLGIEAATFDRFANMLRQIREENKVADIAAFKPVYLKG